MFLIVILIPVEILLVACWVMCIVYIGSTRDTAEEKGGEESCSGGREEIQKRQRREAIIPETWGG